jgi:S-adenosylmethionine-diacylgycerolhomoserine-N-methlytransferase
MTNSAAATVLMNRMYRRQRHFYDFTRKYYLIGRDELIAGLAPAPTDNVLELGCGTGRNLIVAARQYPGTRFCGIDVSTEMLTTAIGAIAAAGLSSRVRVAHGDATRLDTAKVFGSSHFERVFMSYSLSMIPAWRAALDVAIAMLAPGGQLHIVDFGDQERLPRWVRGALRFWLKQFDVIPCDQLDPELRARADRAQADLRVERPYRGYAQYAILQRS